MDIYHSKHPLTDLGYDDKSTEPVEHLVDLSEAPADHSYSHLGYEGYPDGALACYDAVDKSYTLAVSASALMSGTIITAEEALTLLIDECGWPAGTTLGEDGLPVRSEAE